jgi:glycosyltransferase involved in cell wall biosynthesis
VESPARPLRVGIVAVGLEEREADGEVGIANGGVGVYIYQLVKHLQDLDDANEYTLIRLGRGRLDIYERGRVRPVFLPTSSLRKTLTWVDWAYRGIAAERRLDLLHFPNQFGGAFLPRRIRRVVTLHDLTPLLYPRYHPWRRVLGYRLLLRPSLRAADHVIVDAASTATDLVARQLAPPERISVVPLGVGGAFRPALRSPDFAQRYDLPARFILTVGVLEPRKNHAGLLRALDRLHQHGERIGLVIVGRDGWRWRDPLDDPAVSHLRPWVRIHRGVPDRDLPEFYARAEAFAYPSYYEGFGLPILEAMASGIPVVATRTSSLPEVAGDAALLAMPGDADDFAGKLLAVLRDAAVRQRLVSAGRDRCRAFSWQRTAECTRAVYQRVCGRPAGGETTQEAPSIHDSERRSSASGRP